MVVSACLDLMSHSWASHRDGVSSPEPENMWAIRHFIHIDTTILEGNMATSLKFTTSTKKFYF